MSEGPNLEARADEYRDAFDRSFALPHAHLVADVEDLLAIRVGGASYAIRLRDASGVVARRRVVPVPNTAPHLLGVAGIRGGIVPVFSLASILGHASTMDAPRWLVLCGTGEPFALGFSEFEGHLRLPKSAFHVGDLAKASGFTAELARTDAGVLAVIDVALVVANLGSRNSKIPTEKGQ